MKNNLLVCDVETGGLKATENPITQITIEVIDPINFKNLHFYSTFVKPYNNLKIEPKALEHSRVTMKQIEAGATLPVLVKGIMECFKKANPTGKGPTKPYFVGHNFGFDITFLEYLFAFVKADLYSQVQRTFFDTLATTKLYEGNTLKASENSKYTLTNCCERLGVVLHGAHGSENDVEATKQLFIKLVNIQRNANPTTTGATTGNTPNKQDRTRARENFFFEF